MEKVTQFEEMSYKELKEAAADFGLEVGSNPKKATLLEALVEFKEQQDKTHANRIEEKAKVEEAPKVVDGSKRKPQSKAQLLRLDLFKKDRVIVRDLQESQTKDELISVSWGNLTTGGQTDWVDLKSGEPQYIRRGALNNLREAPMVQHIAKNSGGAEQVRGKRFVVVDVPPMTEKELEDLAAQQKMRNSKLA